MAWSDPIGSLIGFFKAGVPTLVENTEPLPVSAATLPLPAGAATAGNQLPDNHQVAVSNHPAEFPLTAAQVTSLKSITVAHALITEPHDEIVLSDYTTDNQPRTVTYKLATVTVATLTLTYSLGAAGGNLLSVVRS